MKTNFYSFVIILFILVSCFTEKEPGPSCPGYVKVCSFDNPFSGTSCWEEWQPCPGPYVPEYKIYPLFNSYSDFFAMAGDTTLVELLYDYFEYDSIIFKICGDVFSRKILPHQVIRRPDPSDLGIAIREKLILNKNLLPGHYQYLIRVWKNQKIVSQLIKDIQVYPPFKIDNTCIESGKKTLTIFPPFDTPDNVKIEIKEVTSLQSDRWVFEEDSIFTLTRLDDLRYCIAIDFRAIENFHLMIDGECIKDTCCNTCSIFINLPTTHYSGVTFYPIEEMIGIIRENKPYVCKIE